MLVAVTGFDKTNNPPASVSSVQPCATKAGPYLLKAQHIAVHPGPSQSVYSSMCPEECRLCLTTPCSLVFTSVCSSGYTCMHGMAQGPRSEVSSQALVPLLPPQGLNSGHQGRGGCPLQTGMICDGTRQFPGKNKRPGPQEHGLMGNHGNRA